MNLEQGFLGQILRQGGVADITVQKTEQVRRIPCDQCVERARPSGEVIGPVLVIGARFHGIFPWYEYTWAKFARGWPLSAKPYDFARGDGG